MFDEAGVWDSVEFVWSTELDRLQLMELCMSPSQLRLSLYSYVYMVWSFTRLVSALVELEEDENSQVYHVQEIEPTSTS